MGQEGRQDKVRLAPDFARLYATESRRFVLWLPVLMGLGIWIYFALETEPPAWVALTALVPACWLVTGHPRRTGFAALTLAWMLAASSIGFALALVSARLADAPRIAYPLGETVEGRVIEISRSASGAPRLLLDKVIVYGLPVEKTPERVRLTMLDAAREDAPAPGAHIRVYATLLPNGEPVEPGGFDFRRHAFFSGLGGIGLVRGAILNVPPGEAGLFDRLFVWLARLRADISDHLRTALPGRQGAFAAAIIVGDRSDIGDADQEALRASNLAHLLAISGLHMGILTGLVFGAVRFGLALVPSVALRFSTKKAAAVAALFAGAGYLALSGATVATQRAFIMVAVMFVAVLLDRPALTLRALALAAVIVLAVRPVSLLEAGFQMSFAATAALVCGFEELRRHQMGRAPKGLPLAVRIGRGVVVYVGGLLAASLLAGLATAPIAAFHFNRTAPWSLLANLAAVPIMGFWIAPMACLALLLAPVGLGDEALLLMGVGIEAVLEIAHWIARLPGAVQPVRSAPGYVLGIIMAGGLWLILWRGWWRLAGVAVIAAGLVAWETGPRRPDLLVSPGARLVGLVGPEGRALDHGKAQSFAAENWLHSDGDWATQAEAAARPGLTLGKRRVSAELGHGWRLEVFHGRGPEPAELARLCQPGTLLIARNGGSVAGGCRYYGKAALARSGALAVTMTPSGPQIRATGDDEGKRLWTRR